MLTNFDLVRPELLAASSTNAETGSQSAGFPGKRKKDYVVTGQNKLEVTALLGRIQDGDKAAEGQLLELTYAELRRLAAGMMRNERSGHTLQATALVNEMALRLTDKEALSKIDNRLHFFSAAANAMRHILVDHARARGTKKRGGDRKRVSFDENLAGGASDDVDTEVWLDAALKKLEAISPRMAQIVVLKRYSGLNTNCEIAELLGMKQRTFDTELATAKAWLYGELKEQSGA